MSYMEHSCQEIKCTVSLPAASPENTYSACVIATPLITKTKYSSFWLQKRHWS